MEEGKTIIKVVGRGNHNERKKGNGDNERGRHRDNNVRKELPHNDWQAGEINTGGGGTPTPIPPTLKYGLNPQVLGGSGPSTPPPQYHRSPVQLYVHLASQSP